MRNFLLLILVITACTPKASNEELTDSARPNILFIMADDHAQKAISAYGGGLIETPNIDRLAQEGALFENSFVTNSICAPSRAVMLTGKFSHINGKRDNLDVFDASQPMFPKLLQREGYETALIGKWHLKSTPQGFDDWKILIDQGDYYTPEFVTNTDTFQQEGYVTDIITDYVLDFLKGRKKQKPFCLFYHHKAPHRNWMPDLEDLKMFAEEDLPVPPTFFDDYEGREAAATAEMRIADMFLSMDMKLHPENYEVENGKGGNDRFDAESAWKGSYNRMTDAQKAAWDAHYDTINAAFANANLSGKELALWKYQRYMKDYLRCIKSVDDNVGRVLDYLDESGLAENTLVVYTSDQGFYLGEHGWYDKRFMYEQSFRTPLLMRLPGTVSPGLRVQELVQNIDYAPTFLDFARVDIPNDYQGLSLKSLLTQQPVDWREALYYHYYEYPDGWHKVKRHYGVRTDRYKLIHFYHDIDTWELYDLQKDPDELNNLYGIDAYAEVQHRLHQKLKELRTQYGDS
ncbi:sulfatase family protein [Marinoscillum furvescens]|uniref:Arylsulfatase A-like enzyme n=1 Tax=Marinoscillum furvescens DSM 4134 TaxID=1122208 RepID=A0A3D9L0H5_MARFU|nr:sulfatase [Marinoscillum furvescens]RED95671.1 arylsulfatase A-like enzyme [Marinoscillum furvescens DSM 4134]